jgi:ribosomal protein S18 acetylase RimI-like enzyme
MTAAAIRSATEADARALVGLLALLGHRMTAPEIAARIRTLQQAGMPQLVAADGDQVVGICGLHQMTAIHRAKPVGRITILAVREDCQGRGIGKALVAAAADHFREQGCGLLEVTSNDRLGDAHAFYVRTGFARTSKRFALTLD